MTEHNSTRLTVKQIRAHQLLGRFRNNWRQRHVEVYASSDPAMVLTIGTSYDGTIRVVCSEERARYVGRIERNDWSAYN